MSAHSKITNLSIQFGDGRKERKVVDGVHLDIAPGSRTAIVGESGSGKSLTALSILGLLPEGAKVSGNIHWMGKNLLRLQEEQLRQVRGREIAMIFQEPMTALNPLFSIGDQIIEAVMIHEPLLERRVAKARAQLYTIFTRDAGCHLGYGTFQNVSERPKVYFVHRPLTSRKAGQSPY